MENDSPVIFLSPPQPTAEAVALETVAATAILIVVGVVLLVAVLRVRRTRAPVQEADAQARRDETGRPRPKGWRAARTRPRSPQGSAPGRAGPGFARRPFASLLKPKADRCRWTRDSRAHGPSLTRWTCATCGVEAYSRDARRPKECKRALRPRAL